MKIDDPAKAEKLIRSMEEDPILFIEVFLQRELTSKQKDFIKSTLTHKHIVAIWSRQTGKSTVIASYIIWRLLYGKGMVINKEWMPEHIAVVAPIKDQIKNLYDKIRTLVDKNDFIAPFIVKMNTELMKMKNGNEAKFLSASPGSQIRGYTATCIIIDESQDITDSKYSGDVLPFGATTNALIIEAGTPKTKNHFWSATSNKDILTIRQPWFECPFLSESYVMAQKSISPLPLWKQEYLCEFVEEGVVAFPSHLFDPEIKDGVMTGRWNLAEYTCINSVPELTKELVDDIQILIKNGATFTFGLDLGKQNDNSVLSVIRTDVRPMRLAALVEFALGTSYTSIGAQVAMFYKVFSPYEFNIDYSNEKSFIDIMQTQDIAIVNDGKNIRGAIQFTNRNKAEMVSKANVLLENYQFQIPKDAEKLISQFLNQQYEVTEQQMYKYFHPSNENDDSLWSVLLALKNIPFETELSISTFQNPWERFDKQVHGEMKESSKEALSSSSTHKRHKLSEGWRRQSYVSADLRRRSGFKMN